MAKGLVLIRIPTHDSWICSDLISCSHLCKWLEVADESCPCFFLNQANLWTNFLTSSQQDDTNTNDKINHSKIAFLTHFSLGELVHIYSVYQAHLCEMSVCILVIVIWCDTLTNMCFPRDESTAWHPPPFTSPLSYWCKVRHIISDAQCHWLFLDTRLSVFTRLIKQGDVL